MKKQAPHMVAQVERGQSMGIKRMVAVGVAAAGLSVMGSGVASAHNVDTPGTCQFLGGPGNPGHSGHANGHTVALAAEQSDKISIIGACS